MAQTQPLVPSWERKIKQKVLGILSFIDWSRSARSEHFTRAETNTEMQRDRMPRSCSLLRKTRC